MSGTRRSSARVAAMMAFLIVLTAGIASVTWADDLKLPGFPGTSEPDAAATAEELAPQAGHDGVPVLVAGQEIYRMRAALGPFSVEERAATAARRIKRLVAAPSFDPAMLAVQEQDGLTRIAYGYEVLFTRYWPHRRHRGPVTHKIGQDPGDKAGGNAKPDPAF